MRWFFIVSGLIACSGTPVRSDCPFEISPPRVVVRFGDPFLANCSSTSNQTRSMGWESIYGGTGRKDGVSSVLLEVDAVKHWNIGPLCFINLIDGHQCSQILPVTIYKTPDSVSISQPGLMGPMVEGEQYRMQCDIANVAPVRNLSVHWHKGNKIVYTETFDESGLSLVNKSSVFSLTAQRGDNGTQIWCEATLDFRPPVPNLPTSQSQAHEVIVLYSPTFTKPENETLELSAGSKMILDCTAAGNPTPVYSWHYPHPIQQTSPNENQPILTPTIELPGTYSCTASNSQGTKTKYFTVSEATRNRTTFAALLGGLVFLGVAFFVGGLLFFVTPEGTFSFSKGGYLKGLPTSSGPI